MKTYQFLKSIAILPLLIISVTVFAGGADETSERCDELLANAESTLFVQAYLRHTPALASIPVMVDARSTKLISGINTDTIPANCPLRAPSAHPIPQGAWRWGPLTKPAGSNAKLVGTEGLKPKFTPDKSGKYIVHFIACPGSSCEWAGTYAQETPVDITINVASHIPPETDVFVPQPQPREVTIPSVFPDVDLKCSYGGGAVDPSWVTVNQWRGPWDYKQLEGKVLKSRVSRQDLFLNHDLPEGQDVNVHVEPDPKYRYLLHKNRNTDVEVEWDRRFLPERYWPTEGDRVSVWGYWIFDCGHNYSTEIHPPVGIAVQRPRPVKIPANANVWLEGKLTGNTQNTQMQLGENIYVPGIVTDIWFHNRGGEALDCEDTSLHQPASPLTISCTGLGIPHPLCQIPGTITIPLTGACIRNPSPLGGPYTFNIYLPRNPQDIVRDYGKGDAPPVPLFVHVSEEPSPAPIIKVKDGYIEVTIPALGNFATYRKRIVAGWVYPAPNNWDIKRSRVRVNNIDVRYDGDSTEAFRGDGDWRFWFNINNTSGEWTNREWTKAYDCDGCVTGNMTYSHLLGSAPWATGPTGKLGPDILLFPQQSIHLHSSGFDDDALNSDDTGTVNVNLPQPAVNSGAREFSNICQQDSWSWCAYYTLSVNILPVAGPGNATLSDGMKDLYKAYSFGSPSDPGYMQPVMTTQKRSTFAMGIGMPILTKDALISDPLNNSVLEPGSEPVDLGTTFAFKPHWDGPHVLASMSPVQLKVKVDAVLQRKQPKKIDRLLTRFRVVAEKWQRRGFDEGIRGLMQYKSAFPADLWNKHLGEIERKLKPLPLQPGKQIKPDIKEGENNKRIR